MRFRIVIYPGYESAMIYRYSGSQQKYGRYQVFADQMKAKEGKATLFIDRTLPINIIWGYCFLVDAKLDN